MLNERQNTGNTPPQILPLETDPCVSGLETWETHGNTRGFASVSTVCFRTATQGNTRVPPFIEGGRVFPDAVSDAMEVSDEC